MVQLVERPTEKLNQYEHGSRPWGAKGFVSQCPLSVKTFSCHGVRTKERKKERYKERGESRKNERMKKKQKDTRGRKEKKEEKKEEKKKKERKKKRTRKRREGNQRNWLSGAIMER